MQEKSLQLTASDKSLWMTCLANSCFAPHNLSAEEAQIWEAGYKQALSQMETLLDNSMS